MAIDVRLKRIYEPPQRADGDRVLVERLWPRGVTRNDARIDDWARELAPSDELRRWYDHNPARFDEFRRRYMRELSAKRPPAFGDSTAGAGRQGHARIRSSGA